MWTVGERRFACIKRWRWAVEQVSSGRGLSLPLVLSPLVCLPLLLKSYRKEDKIGVLTSTAEHFFLVKQVGGRR